MPITKRMRRPSLSDTRSTSPRKSSRPAASCRARGETPVGARNSPNSARSASPHSPVVTPALAASIEAGMMFAPLAAAARSAVSASRTRASSRAARQALRRAICSASASARGHEDRVLARGQRRGLGIGEGVDADDDLLAALDRLEPAGVRFDELRLQRAGLDRLDRAAHRVDRRDLGQRLALELLDQGGDLLADPRTGRRIRAGRSRRP